MRVYQFTEQAYYPAWDDHKGSLRINLPNTKLDPNIAGQLLNRYYKAIQKANPGVDERRLRPGTVIKMPDAAAIA